MWSSIKKYLETKLDPWKHLTKKDENNFFEVYKAYRKCPEPGQIFAESMFIEEITSIYCQDCKQQVIILYKGNNFVFNMIPTFNNDLRGTIRVVNDTECEYMHAQECNGIHSLIANLGTLIDDTKRILHFANNTIQRIDYLQIDYLADAQKLIIEKSAKKEELKAIPQYFENLKSICMHTTPSEEVGQFALTCQTACISNATDLKLADLIQMESEFVNISNSNLSLDDVMLFVHYWSRKGLPANLSMLQIKDPRIVKHHPVIPNTETLPFNPNNRTRFFSNLPCHIFDTKNGRDIERKDGKFATILLQDGMVQFFIWKSRYPKVPEDFEKCIKTAEIGNIGLDDELRKLTLTPRGYTKFGDNCYKLNECSSCF